MIPVSVGSDYEHARVRRLEFDDFGELVQFIREAQPDGRPTGPYFCAPMLNGHRSAADAQPTALVIPDFDDLPAEAPRLLCEAIQSAGLRAALWTTRRSTPEKPRLRLVCELSRPVDKPTYAAVYRGLVRHLGEMTGLVLVADDACEKPEQAAVLPQPGSTLWASIDGAPIDVDAYVEFDPAPASKASASTPPPAAGGQVDKGRNNYLSRLAFKLRKAGLDPDEIAPALLEVNARRCDPPLPGDEVRGIADRKSIVTPETVDGPLPYRWAGAIVAKRKTEYVVKQVLGRARQATAIAEPGVGKTFFVFRLACHVAADRDWYGHRVQKGAVLWLGLEGEEGLELRTLAHRQAGVLEPDAPLALVTVPVSLLCQADDIVQTALVAARERDERPSLVVVDTLSRALAGQDENASEVMTAAVRAGDTIRAETGASVVFIHHPAKNAASGGRGHSSLYGAVDLELNLVRNGDDRRAIVRKNRDGMDGTEYPFRLDVVNLGLDDEGDPVTSCVAVPTDAGPLRSVAARSENQRATLKRLRAWVGKQSGEQIHLATDELHELLKEVGITQRQRRFDVVEWLINAGALTRAVGGYLVHPEVFK